MYLNLEPWDLAACVVILREAGARVTTADNRDRGRYKNHQYLPQIRYYTKSYLI